MLYFLIGYGCGATTFIWFSWRVHCRMCYRIEKNRNLEELTAQLKKRREAIDSGRDTEPVTGAGDPAVVSSLFSTQPGTMYLDRLTRRKTPNFIDTLPNSTYSIEVSNDPSGSPTEGSS